jgi:hypothetical protein
MPAPEPSSIRERRRPRCLRACAALILAAAVVVGTPALTRRISGSVVWTLDNVKSIGGYAVIIIGAPKVVTTPAGPVIEFNGTTDGFLIDVNPIEGLAQFTVEAIFAPAPDGPEEQRFLHISENGSERRLMMETRVLPDHTWALDTYLRMEAPGLALLDRAKTHSSGTWHAAALTYDGKTMTSYVDGIKELSGEVPFAPLKAGKIGIGVRQNLVSWFKGRIRTIRITPEALPAGKLLAAGK